MGNDQPLTGNEADIIERLTRVETKLEVLTEIKDELRRMRDGCPLCTNVLATHTSEIKALTARIVALETNVEAVWNRGWWAVGLGASAFLAVLLFLLKLAI